jgi:hypothetical protein
MREESTVRTIIIGVEEAGRCYGRVQHTSPTNIKYFRYVDKGKHMKK